MRVECPISLGELVDKISILRVKIRNIDDEKKILAVKKEELLLKSKLEDLNLDGVDFYMDELLHVNSELWKVEDDIRIKERESDFNEEFVALARKVYITNDRRFKVKSEINSRYSSEIEEVKSYEEI